MTENKNILTRHISCYITHSPSNILVQTCKYKSKYDTYNYLVYLHVRRSIRFYITLGHSKIYHMYYCTNNAAIFRHTFKRVRNSK